MATVAPGLNQWSRSATEPNGEYRDAAAEHSAFFLVGPNGFTGVAIPHHLPPFEPCTITRERSLFFSFVRRCLREVLISKTL